MDGNLSRIESSEVRDFCQTATSTLRTLCTKIRWSHTLEAWYTCDIESWRDYFIYHLDHHGSLYVAGWRAHQWLPSPTEQVEIGLVRTAVTCEWTLSIITWSCFKVLIVTTVYSKPNLLVLFRHWSLHFTRLTPWLSLVICFNNPQFERGA